LHQKTSGNYYVFLSSHCHLYLLHPSFHTQDTSFILHGTKRCFSLKPRVLVQKNLRVLFFLKLLMSFQSLLNDQNQQQRMQRFGCLMYSLFLNHSFHAFKESKNLSLNSVELLFCFACFILMAKLMGNHHSFCPFRLKFHVPALLKTLFRFSASNNEWPDEISKATLEKPKHERRKKIILQL